MTSILTSRWQVASPLLDELLELDVPQRDARLARLRGEDPALADALAALLAVEPAIERSGFLEGSALDAQADPAEPLAGKRIGPYALERPLGQGGMGSVWLARRVDGRYEGQVAIKLLNLALIARGGAERFRREGQVLAKLAHPGIARLLDAGVAEGGQPFLVLEYVDGEPIDRWCERRALAPEARVRLFLDVLAAVDHAHGSLVLHRDLKPGNILVTRDGGVKLLDFGIAKLLDASERSAGATELTRAAGRAFTPEYAAPEQVRGEDLTTATDVYALGVLLYRLLSGEHPTTKPSSNPVDALRAVVDAEPAPVSQAASRTGAASRTALSGGDLDNIVAKALRKAPRERYANAAAFADDLGRYLRREPVSARPDSRGYRLRKFVERHRWGVGAASATLLALLAGVVATTWQAIEARRERDQALFQAERALARGSLVELMLGAMGSAERALTQSEVLDRSVAIVEKRFMHDPRIAVDLLLPIAGQYMSLGNTTREYEVMQRAASVARASGDARLIASVACNTVETELYRGRRDLAREQLELGRRALAELHRPPLGTVLSCSFAEAEIARRDEDYERSVALARASLALAERERYTQGNLYPKLLGFLSVVQQGAGDVAASHATLKRLQAFQEKLGRSGTVDELGQLRAEAVLLAAMGEHAAARRMIDEIVVQWPARSGGDTAPPPITLTQATLAHRLGDLDTAHRVVEETIARWHALGGTQDVVSAQFALARVLVHQGRLDEAERVLAPIEAAGARVRRSSQFTVPTARAELLLARGALREAAQTIEREVALLGGKDAPHLASALRVAASVHLAAGDALLARERAASAAAVAERVARDPARSGDVGEALLLAARALQALGEHAAAVDGARRALPRLAAGLGEGHALTREALALSQR